MTTTQGLLLQEKHKKLWHTPFYDNEMKLKQLYIKLCHKLPGCGCKLFQVKEILRGNIHRKVPRLFGVGPERMILLDAKSKQMVRQQNVTDLRHWHLGGGVHAVELEFHAARPWLFACPTEDSLRSVSAALWEVLDCDGQLLVRQNMRRNSLDFGKRYCSSWHETHRAGEEYRGYREN